MVENCNIQEGLYCPDSNGSAGIALITVYLPILDQKDRPIVAHCGIRKIRGVVGISQSIQIPSAAISITSTRQQKSAWSVHHSCFSQSSKNSTHSKFTFSLSTFFFEGISPTQFCCADFLLRERQASRNGFEIDGQQRRIECRCCAIAARLIHKLGCIAKGRMRSYVERKRNEAREKGPQSHFEIKIRSKWAATSKYADAQQDNQPFEPLRICAIAAHFFTLLRAAA